jgi:alpha-beta hydrolase superfamily lysophospholipase
MFRLRARRFLLSVFIVVITGLAVTIWIAAGELVSPERRQLQDYHREWLDHSAAHGLVIKRFSTARQRTPCLFAEPDPQAGPAERGQRLRDQLHDLGDTLEPYGTVKATLVLLHGRKGRKEDLLPVAERFCAAGFRCLMPDLPAHGENPTATVRFATAEDEARLAETVLTEAADQFHFSPGPVGLWGMSMGGAFAVRAAASSPDRWQSLVIVSSFDSLGEVIDGQLRWSRGGAGWIRTAVATVASARGGVTLPEAKPVVWAAKVKMPVLVAHGDADSLIPLAGGQRLFQAFASGDKRFVTVPSGDHDNVLITPMPLYSIMADWFLHSLRITSGITPAAAER